MYQTVIIVLCRALFQERKRTKAKQHNFKCCNRPVNGLSNLLQIRSILITPQHFEMRSKCCIHPGRTSTRNIPQKIHRGNTVQTGVRKVTKLLQRLHTTGHMESWTKLKDKRARIPKSSRHYFSHDHHEKSYKQTSYRKTSTIMQELSMQHISEVRDALSDTSEECSFSASEFFRSVNIHL